MATNLIKLIRQKYFTIVNLILITVFIGIVVSTMYDVLTMVLDKHAVAPVIKPLYKKSGFKKPRRKSLSSYSAVSKRNLFKTASLSELEKKDELLNVDVMDITDLKLKLWGTIVAGNFYSRAIIEETKTREQKLYKVGDTIQTATLKHVLRNKVVLSVNGKDEILEIEQETGKGQSNRRRNSFGSVAESGNKKTKNITVKRSLIEDSMQNLNKLMKDVRIRPHFRNGESDGLIVSGIKGGSVFRKLGLRNGDIIMGVDGSQIESVDDAMKLYSGLNDLENMKVDIKRRGKLQTLNFNIE